jgi:hypothetical protein
MIYFESCSSGDTQLLRELGKHRSAGHGPLS